MRHWEGSSLRLLVERGFKVKSFKSVVVGALAAVVVFGGMQVVSGVTPNHVSPNHMTRNTLPKLCANDATGVVRYTTKSCGSKETTLSVNQQGIKGVKGAKGLAGVKGDAGTNGTNGTAGANGTNGTAGAKGDDGTAGAKGDDGTDGTNATVKITELSVCGADGVTLCKIGKQGPGGGIIFFVDYNDQYAGFNYLEAAPLACEVTKAWSSDTTNSLLAVNGWAARAVGSGQTNTTAMLTSSGSYVGDTAGAAFYANNLSSTVPGGGCVTAKDDWFLGSLGEMKLMYDNLQGVGGFVVSNYWSSSESNGSSAWPQSFYFGYQSGNFKYNDGNYVRPVRAF